MYVKDLFKPSDYVEPVPLGIPMTLTYNSKGTLESVMCGYPVLQKFCQDKAQDLYVALAQNLVVPMSIGITGGTTQVMGVLHTDKVFYNEGNLPDAIIPAMIEDFIKSPTKYTFYAGSLHSLAKKSVGAASVRQWLVLSKFNVLPGWVMPQDTSEDNFKSMILKNRNSFEPELTMGYIIFRGSDILYSWSNISQIYCKSVTIGCDPNGNIIGVILDSAGHEKTVRYSDIVKYNIQKHSRVILDGNGIIQYSDISRELRTDRVSNILTCPTCGRVIRVPSSGSCQCSNPDCTSRLYPRISQFCQTLGIEKLSFSAYKQYIDKGMLLGLLDIFGLPEYKDVHIECNLSQLLRALIPLSVEPIKSIIDTVVNNCNNSVNTVMYYAQNPTKIVVDFGLPERYAVAFKTWFSEDSHVLELSTLTQMNNVTILSANVKFNGSPILRGRKVSLTGTFRHGKVSDVSAILRSYSAEVVEFNESTTNCLIVGDIKQDVKGYQVNYCKTHNIPVYTETEFFDQLNIDADISKNLNLN